MLSLSNENKANINSKSLYFHDLLNIDNEYFEMVDTIYPNELPLNKTNTFDTEAPFLDLNLSISNDKIFTTFFFFFFFFLIYLFIYLFIFWKTGRLWFWYCYYSISGCHATPYGLYVSRLLRFARTSIVMFCDFNNRK